MTDTASPQSALRAILDHVVENAASEGMGEAALEARAGLSQGSLAQARSTGHLDFTGLYRLCEIAELDLCAVQKDDYGRRLDRGLF